MSKKIASVVVRAINRLHRIRDAVYLDTNAWSSLAKGTLPLDPIKEWAKANGYHFWLARFQVAELSRDTRLARPFAEMLRGLPVTMIDYGQNEFQATPWHQVEMDLDLYNK